MIKIVAKEKLKYIQADITEGYLTEEKPLLFISGGFTQSLTEDQWKKLKGLTGKDKKEEKQEKKEEKKEDKKNEENDLSKKELTGLELLKSKYETLKDKKSSEAANLRKQIKELEEQDKKGGK